MLTRIINKLVHREECMSWKDVHNTKMYKDVHNIILKCMLWKKNGRYVRYGRSMRTYGSRTTVEECTL